MTDQITLTDFAPRHLAGALRLSQQAGWPHRLEDWVLLSRLSRGTVALAEDSVVATAFATPYGEVAMANMIIVDEAMRGRGLGRKVLERAMAAVQPREWRLIATEDGRPLYEKLGFVACGQILQLQGLAAPVARPAGVDWAADDLADDLAAIEDLDRQAFGAARTGLIALLAERGRLAVLRAGGDLAGYAAIRDFGRGAVIGPVVARKAEDARRLIAFLLAERTGRFTRLDTTDTSGLAPWLVAQGLAHVGGGIAMRRGPARPDPDVQIFALAAQALG